MSRLLRCCFFLGIGERGTLTLPLGFRPLRYALRLRSFAPSSNKNSTVKYDNLDNRNLRAIVRRWERSFWCHIRLFSSLFPFLPFSLDIHLYFVFPSLHRNYSPLTPGRFAPSCPRQRLTKFRRPPEFCMEAFFVEKPRSPSLVLFRLYFLLPTSSGSLPLSSLLFLCLQTKLRILYNCSYIQITPLFILFFNFSLILCQNRT